MNKTSRSTFATFIQHSFGSPSHGNQKRKGSKRSGKEIKPSLFAHDMILYIESSKDATRKPLELINKFSKLQDTELVHGDLLHFYTITTKIRK